MRTSRRLLTIFSTAILALIGGLPGAAHATWLGLEDGAYNVTLECLFSSVIACPSTIHGQVTIAGAGASFLSVTVNGEVFSGDPVDDDIVVSDHPQGAIPPGRMSRSRSPICAGT